MLHHFLTSHRAEIIARAQSKVSARGGPRATELDRGHGLPRFFAQLTETLRHPARSHDEIRTSATQHGCAMMLQGFSVADVVHEYSGIGQAITELALELKVPIALIEFHALNRCVDVAIGEAVTEYARRREKSLSDEGTQYIGFLAHEMRNKLSTAILSLGMLEDGGVLTSGRAGVLLARSLKGLSDLIDRALAEVRQESSLEPQKIMISEFIEEFEFAANLEAKNRNRQLIVDSSQYGVAVDVDRPLLEAAVANLLQNAFKFTPEHGRVMLRTRATADRVFIDVEDECGGLPPGKIDTLFRPFHQRGRDRSGLGLGLSISRRGVRLNGGEIHVRDNPGTGCVFTIELPRSSRQSRVRGGAARTASRDIRHSTSARA